MEGGESEPDRSAGVERTGAEVDWQVVSPDDVAGVEAPRVVEWEDMEQEIARLWSLSAALRTATERKQVLSHRLDSIIKVRSGTLQRTNELEDMKKKLEARKAVQRNLLIFCKNSSEDVETRIEHLSLRIRTLLVASKTLSVAHNQLQEAKNLLSGENGHCRLKKIQEKLRMRQQHMVSQVASIYPVRTLDEHIFMKILDSHSSSSKSTGDVVPPSKSISRGSSQSSLTILGMQLMALPVKKTGYFSDKKEVQQSATALGYAAHALQLIASYLEVPLRYPLRLGGSRSYIHDYAPSVESFLSSADSAATSPALSLTSTIPTEFPLFFDGQDTITRASYAIFLLSKDLEQVLNYIGAESLGPRHILANLKELMRVILSDEFLDRFDLIYLILDKADEQTDRCLAKHIVSLFFQNPDTPVHEVLDLPTLVAFISYAKKHIHPELSDEAAEELTRRYVQMRQRGNTPGSRKKVLPISFIVNVMDFFA